MRDPASRPSSARFVDLTCVYQRYVQSGLPVTSFDESPSALACSCDEPSMCHPVAIHHDHHHIHPMVTRRSTCVIRPVDRLVLKADTALAPSLIPSIHIALADPHGRRAMEYVPLLANHTKDFKEPCPPGTNMVTGKWIFRHKLEPTAPWISTRLVGSFGASLSARSGLRRDLQPHCQARHCSNRPLPRTLPD
jgi:hypothetical protein